MPIPDSTMEWGSWGKALQMAWILSRGLGCKYRVYSFKIGKNRRWTVERILDA